MFLGILSIVLGLVFTLLNPTTLLNLHMWVWKQFGLDYEKILVSKEKWIKSTGLLYRIVGIVFLILGIGSLGLAINFILSS